MKKGRKTSDKVFIKLFKETKPIRGWLILSVFLCLGIIACAVHAPEEMGKLIDSLFAYDSQSGVPITAILLPGILILLVDYLIHAVLKYANSFVMLNAVSRYFTCNMRIKISEKLSRLPISYMDKTPVGEIIDRMQEDISTMGTTIHSVIEMLIIGFLQMIVISVMMFLSDWRLALIVVLIAPLSVYISSRVAVKGEVMWEKSFELFGKMYSSVEEGYTNFAATKAYNLEHYLEKKNEKINTIHQNAAFKGYFWSDAVAPVITLANALSYILIALAGGWLIVSNSGVSVGTVVTVILFSKQFSEPLQRISESFATIHQAKAASKRVYELLETPEEERPEKEINVIKGEISFENVDFYYNPEKPLIRGLTVDVKSGQTVAIVGPTGAGKTTLVNLLMRFYDNQGGKIRIDGQDIKEYSRDSVRNLFGMVLQDTWLFKGTVAENIAYGKSNATREEIMKACDMAYCDHFIRTLSSGYDTVIDEDSAMISAGEKQLMTIARALLADRQLLILDEATSNVDTRTEILIQKAMDKLMKGKTCFVIAHRLSTIVDADVILVIRDGQIVEKGTHSELFDRKGFYYELYQSQYSV